jgi:hypothetical protein
MLTFEHQGCREFEAAKQVVIGDEAPKGDGEEPRREAGAAEAELLENLRNRATELEELLDRSTDQWGYEDPIYRFYHQSFKVYYLQRQTRSIVDRLEDLLPGRPLNPWFMDIIEAGIGRQFNYQHNAQWTQVTRPIVEAFFHARFFLQMAVRYSDLDAPPKPLPSGYAALLYLYGLR